MSDREAFEAWFESQSTSDLAAFAVGCASRSIKVYEECRDPEEYMRDLFQSTEYSSALGLAESYLQDGSGLSREVLVAAVPMLRNSIKFLEENIEEASGGAEVVAQRRRALFACKAVQHAVTALVWPLASEEELSQCFGSDERIARTKNGGRHHARLAIELSAKALRVGLVPFSISMGAAGLQ